MHFLFEFDYHDLQKYTLKPQFSIGSVTGQDYILKDSNSVKLFTECVGSKLSCLMILFREVRLLLPHQVLSVPKFIENLHCICHKSILKQMQYRFAVDFGTLSI